MQTLVYYWSIIAVLIIVHPVVGIIRIAMTSFSCGKSLKRSKILHQIHEEALTDTMFYQFSSIGFKADAFDSLSYM